MRHWRARPDTGAGALFGYLAAGKRSVIGDPASAEVLALDGRRRRRRSPTSVPGGRWPTSPRPHRRRPSSSPSRRSAPPVPTSTPACRSTSFCCRRSAAPSAAAAGPVRSRCRRAARIGEWFAGAYAAVAAAASVRAARRTGSGETIDLSIFEAMVIAMGSLGAVSASVLGDDSGPGPAQPRTAVHRADRRRNGGVLHHHRAAVSGLPGAHRTARPARRRRIWRRWPVGSGVATSSWRWFTTGRPTRPPTKSSNWQRLSGFPWRRSRRRRRITDHRPLRASVGCSSAPRAAPSRRGSPTAVPRIPTRRPGGRAGPGRRQRTGGLATGRDAARAAKPTRRRNRVAADRGARRGLHRLLGRAAGDPGAGRARRRRHQGRRRAASGRHAIRRRTATRAGTSGGSGARSSCAATPTSAASASNSARRKGGRRRWNSSRTAIWSSRTSRRG